MQHVTATSNASEKYDLNERKNLSNGKVNVDRPRSSFASNHTLEELNMSVEAKRKSNSIENNSEEGNLNESQINEALAMFIDADLSKDGYEKIRHYNLRLFGSKMYSP